MNDIDLVDLQLFVFIVQANNLSQGADRARMSVSEASMRIQKLEDSLNVKLYDQDNQGITLQPPGEKLLHHACQILQQIDALNDELRQYIHQT